MISPNERYREFKGWIPSQDVDGIDSPKDYLRDVTNMDFNNGFLSTAPAPVKYALPAPIVALIVSGWELLRYKYFRHSIQGDTYLSVLYKYSTEHELKFFVNSTELFLDEATSDITISAKPTNISFALVQDQLKVNLNVIGTYNSIPLKTYLNLTLVHLPYSRYGHGIGTHLDREEGWYLFPRWLGWTHDNSLINTPITSSLYEFNGSIDSPQNSEILAFSGTSIFTGTVVVEPYSGSGSLQINQNGYFSIGNIDYATGLEFTFAYKITDTTPARALLRIVDGSDDTILQEIDLGDTDYLWTFKKVSLPFMADIKVTFVVEDVASWGFLVDQIRVVYNYEYVVIGKGYDGQRGLLQSGDDLNKNSYYKIDKARIDWRIEEYEIYAKTVADSDIYYLVHTAVLSGDWEEATYPGYLYLPDISSAFDSESTTTLNFNYGLGAVNVYYEETLDSVLTRGMYIYSEVFYRNRSYFVKNTEKLFYSHISGTGLPQPDSFPYDESLRFGYYVTSYDSVNKALAITALEEIVIYTEKLNWIYTIEGTAGTPYRKIKANNGGFGILSERSMITDLTGMPLAKVLMWFDQWGVYAYAGGRSVPTSVTASTHKNYWKELQSKSMAIAIYNKARNEYWIQVGSDILLFEIETSSWRKYTLSYKIIDWVGIINDKTYVLGDDNAIYALDPTSTEGYLEGSFEFHDNACSEVSERGYVSPAPEIQDKVLQDMFIHFKDIVGDSQILIDIIADDNIIEENISLGTMHSRLPSKTPLLIIYGKIRFRFKLEAVKVSIKEFGFGYDIVNSASPSQSALIALTQAGFGQEVGGEFGTFL